VLQGLLRERLGFGGVVMTDCLEMRAIADTAGVAHGAVLALRAGADLVLISHTASEQRAAIAAIAGAVGSGDLAADQLSAAADRVLALKREYLAWNTLPAAHDLEVVGSSAHQALRDRVYARTTTLVRDRDGLLPLRLGPAERMLVVTRPGTHVSQAVDVPYTHDALVACMRQRHPETAGFVSVGDAADDVSALERALAAADLVLVATINAHLDPAQAALAHRALATGRPVIALALCDPYDLAVYPEVSTYLALYEYTEPALDAAVAVIFGEHPAMGRLPVSVPGL
jgi:beta-N-acetylhexosaminidase